MYGLAVDVGTTKLAAYLVDLENGETIAKSGAMNPQIAYGEDVISRIHYSNQHADGSGMLQARLVETLNGLVAELCSQACIHPDQVVEAVIVGNTAMYEGLHQAFIGIFQTGIFSHNCDGNFMPGFLYFPDDVLPRVKGGL